MCCIRVQRLLRLEVGYQDGVAGVVPGAAVDTDLDVVQSRNAPAQTLEGLLDADAGLHLLLG